MNTSARHLFAALLAYALGHTSLVLPIQAQPAPAPAEVPTELRSQQLEMTSTDDETTAIATTDVILTGTNLRITCDQLTIVASRPAGAKKLSALPDDEKIDQIKHILATGNVRIVQGDREATAQRAEVFPREDRVVLSGAPVIIDHSSGMVASGEPLILLRGQRAVLGTNVKITAPPIGDLSATAAPKSPARTPAPSVTFPGGVAK